MNTQAYQQKTEKIFDSEEIKFYRIGLCLHKTNQSTTQNISKKEENIIFVFCFLKKGLS
jgi:hypothetical protein